MSDNRFCPLCDVSLDLHSDPDDVWPEDCSGAEAKERVIRMFNQVAGIR